jgi:type II secretory pathway component PulF
MSFSFSPFRSGIFRVELVDFFKNLSLMVRSGIPLNEAIRVLQLQTRHRIFRQFLVDIQEGVESGTSLSVVLAPYRRDVGDLVIHTIRAGELNGNLAENLEYLADLLTRRHELVQKLRAVLLYPEIVSVMAFVIGGGQSRSI